MRLTLLISRRGLRRTLLDTSGRTDVAGSEELVIDPSTWVLGWQQVACSQARPADPSKVASSLHHNPTFSFIDAVDLLSPEQTPSCVMSDRVPTKQVDSTWPATWDIVVLRRTLQCNRVGASLPKCSASRLFSPRPLFERNRQPTRMQLHNALRPGSMSKPYP
jgi:hypothetical protein